MAMAQASSRLLYPQRFYAAASYAGFDGSPHSASKAVRSESALILYALYQQATVGPCNAPEPSAWNAVEKSKWSSWKKLADMASTEAMRLFVKILEEEDPGWYSRVSNFFSELVVDVQMNQNSSIQPVVENGNSFPETKTISTENGSIVEAQDKDVVSEGFGSVVVYDQWTAPPLSGLRQNPDTECMEEGEMAQQQRPRLPPEIRRIPRELPHRPPGRAGVARHAGYLQCAPSRLVILIFAPGLLSSMFSVELLLWLKQAQEAGLSSLMLQSLLTLRWGSGCHAPKRRRLVPDSTAASRIRG
ncbi:hypothetical protein TB2_027209 [Malus domestica]